jgi:glucosamine--fructose-6-phosphate aminotransferase (isomerizing)
MKSRTGWSMACAAWNIAAMTAPGVCTVFDGQLVRRRAEGKLNNLVKELAVNPAPGLIGIAHTRWATHGAPTTSNAHPHATGEVALVHNGIIENFRPCARR